MAPETRYAKSAGLNIAFQVIGEGPPDLVAVPGFVSHVEAAWEWPYLARYLHRLATFSRLTMFDKRGTGLSDPVAGDVTFAERVDDIRAVMDASGIERAHLLGVSEGGAMSVGFATTYPDRVVSLILYGSYARRVRTAGYPWGATQEELETSEPASTTRGRRVRGGTSCIPSDPPTLRHARVGAVPPRCSQPGDGKAAPRAERRDRHPGAPGAGERPNPRHPPARRPLDRGRQRPIPCGTDPRCAARGARRRRSPPLARRCRCGPGCDPGVRRARCGPSEIGSAAFGVDALSRREREVVHLAIAGESSAQIATHLFVSERTIETHLSNAYTKLGVHSRVELIRRAPELGL